jgi:hypothetical protein
LLRGRSFGASTAPSTKSHVEGPREVPSEKASKEKVQTEILKRNEEISLLCSEVVSKDQEISHLKKQLELVSSERDKALENLKQKNEMITELEKRLKEFKCPYCFMEVSIGIDDLPLPKPQNPEENLLSDDALYIDEKTMRRVYDQLESETNDLKVIEASASHLLHYEREDRPESKIAELTVRRRSMEVDSDMFQGVIRARMSAMQIKTPQRYTLHKMKDLNYYKMLEEQDEMLKTLQGSHKKYESWLDRSLVEIKKKADAHFNIGEFRDQTELRLKTQLGILIGQEGAKIQLESQNVSQDPSVMPTRLQIFQGAHDILLKQLDDFVQRVDISKDGLMQMEELLGAVNKDTKLWEELHVLAVNFAFCPENRLQSDVKEFNDMVQNALDRIMANIDNDQDGILTADEIRNMSPELKDRLRNLGIGIQI